MDSGRQTASGAMTPALCGFRLAERPSRPVHRCHGQGRDKVAGRIVARGMGCEGLCCAARPDENEREGIGRAETVKLSREGQKSPAV